MKIAKSVSDDLFKEGEKVALENHYLRSEVFCSA